MDNMIENVVIGVVAAVAGATAYAYRKEIKETACKAVKYAGVLTEELGMELKSLPEIKEEQRQRESGPTFGPKRSNIVSSKKEV